MEIDFEFALDDTEFNMVYCISDTNALCIVKHPIIKPYAKFISIEYGDFLQIKIVGKVYEFMDTAKSSEDAVIEFFKIYNELTAPKKSLWLIKNGKRIKIAKCDITKNHNSTVRANTNKE